MKNSRILITGGAGFIGSHIADLLLREGVREIIVLDNLMRGRRENLAPALASGRVRLVEGDIRDARLVGELMAGVDTVFHEAALRITHCAENPRLAHEVLATGSFNVLEAAVRAGVRRVVAASSASVYGLAESFPTAESHHPYANATLYGALKLYLEGLLRSFHDMHGLDYVATRAFNVYGPRMDVHGVYTEVMIRWIERIAAGQSPVVMGDGSQTMDFVYVEDVARANVLAAKCERANEVVNLGSGTETSLRELAATLLEVMDARLEVAYAPERRVNPVRRRLADTVRAKRLIGFEAEIGLREGLRRLVEWWRTEKGCAAAP
jgi:UDP-glucose 4-epimerase